MAESQEKIPEGLVESVQPEKVKTADPRTHYVELDALRGIAILGVMMNHIAGWWTNLAKVPLPIPILNVDALGLFSFGNYGVSLFFLLSGYLLTWTEEKRARTGAYSLRAYALRRVFRLVPAYYVAIVIVAIVWPLAIQEVSGLDILINASFLRTLFPVDPLIPDPTFWSLTPEVAFYCLLPFIVLKLPRLSQRLILFGALTLVSLATWTYIALNSEPFDFQAPGFTDFYFSRLPSTHLYLFLAGVLLRMLVERLNTQPMPERVQSLLASILFLASTLFLVTCPYLLMDVGQATTGPATMLVNLMVIAFFASALLGAPLLRGVLSWRPLAFIGMISYSLFVFHATVIVVCTYFYNTYLRRVAKHLLAHQSWQGEWLHFGAYALVILAVSGAISYLSYRYIEGPFLRYKPK